MQKYISPFLFWTLKKRINSYVSANGYTKENEIFRKFNSIILKKTLDDH